jgi:hypothetical protein
MTPLGEAVGTTVIITGVYSLSRGETVLVVAWVLFALLVTVAAHLWGGDEK